MSVNHNRRLHLNNLIRVNNLFLVKSRTGRLRPWYLILLLAALSLACSLASAGADGSTLPAFETAEPVSIPVVAALVSPTPFPIETVSPEPPEPAPTVEPSPTLESLPTIEPVQLPAPDPYASLTIDHLASRAYGGGSLEIRQVMQENSYFTRYEVIYPSDGLQIYGFMNVPKRGEAPYPVVIALHGYIDPAVYTTLDYTTGYADTLARAGFLVIHPNLRNYPPSDTGENLFRVGMTVDVLNLIALVRQQGGAPGPLSQAQPGAIGLWGHSMGGGISLRTAVVDPEVKAVVLYAAMSGDERQNFEAISRWSGGQRGQAELQVPLEILPAVSPVYFLERIQAAVSIHHGESDQLVPLQWSLDLCSRQMDAGKAHECLTYPGQPHTFNEAGNQVFMQRVIEFYERELKP